MAEFKYEVINPSGKVERGRISGRTELEIIQTFSRQGYTVRNVSEISASLGTSNLVLFPVKLGELALFSRQMATMISSGVRIRDSLEILSSQLTFSKKFRKILTQTVISIESGQSFYEAASETGVFDDFFLSLIQSAEEGGTLEESLEKIAEYYEGKQRIQNKIKSAMAYPLFVMGFAIIMVFAIAFFILPNLLSAFGSMYTPSGVIKLLLDLKSLLENHWPIVIPAAIGVIFVMFLFMKSKYGMVVKDFLGNIFPPVRKLRNLTAVERFSKTLSILVSSGVEITKALELSAKVTQRPKIIKRMVIVISRIKDGEELNKALKEQDIFPPIAISMVSIGEETGQLGEVMDKVAEFYAEQVDTGIKALVSLLEPLMIMFVGLMVGFIAYSMYDAIYSMQGALA